MTRRGMPLWAAERSWESELRGFGYRYLGPFIAGFCQWVHEQKAALAPDARLLFMARDCALIHAAYSRLFPGDGATSHYTRGSRAAARLAGLSTPEAVWSRLRDVRAGDSVGEILEREYHIASDWSPDLRVSVTRRKGRKLLEARVRQSMDEIVGIARRHREAYTAYLARLAAGGDVLVVDIGYAGTAQRLFSSLLGYPVGGLYMVTHRAARSVAETCGSVRAYDGDFLPPESAESFVNHHRYFFEAVLSSAEGSFLRYARDGEPVYSPPPRDNRSNRIRAAVHEGALSFAGDLAAERDAGRTRAACSARALTHFLDRPTARDAAMFAGLAFEDAFGGAPSMYVIAPIDQRQHHYAAWIEGQRAVDRASSPPQRAPGAAALERIELGVAERLLSKAQFARFSTHRRRYLLEATHPLLRLYGRLTG